MATRFRAFGIGAFAVLLSGLVTDAQAALVISTGPTANVNCVSNVCTATASSAVLNIGDLKTMLAASNVTVVAGSAAKDIQLKAALSWVSANTLTLDAFRSIAINKPLSVTGPGGLTLTTNDGGTEGTLSFNAAGNATFWSLSDSLIINGAAYALVNNIATLASDIAGNPSGDYALANSYDAKPDHTYTTVPIPTAFTGTFEGLGNTISNLTIRDSTDTDIGLFSVIDTSGVVRDIELVNAHVTRTNQGVAYTVGTLVGRNSGTIFRASATGSVVAHRGAVGGLVGDNSGGNIVEAHASDTVTAAGFAGGAGGLVGLDGGGTIISSFASGAVSGEFRSTVGGLVSSISFPTVVTNCYATGVVTGGKNSIVGGFVGVRDADVAISNSYSTGTVVAGAGKSTAVGGFIGLTGDTSTHAYWDTTTSGTDIGVGKGTDTGVSGLTTTQLQSGLPAGFASSIWAENPSINGGLPYPIANPPS